MVCEFSKYAFIVDVVQFHRVDWTVQKHAQTIGWNDLFVLF